MTTMLLREPADRAAVTRESRAARFEVRAADDGSITFDGTASVVDTPYAVRDALGEYAETMRKGAFSRSLKHRDDVRLLVNHDGVPLARTASGTLKLTADPDLRALADLDPANPTVQEVRSAMERRDLDQMSIGFQVIDQRWNKDYTEREIREVKLFDVSVVTYPANTTTSAQLRSVDELIESLADVDLSPDELRRAILALEALLPHDEVEERTEDLFAQRDRDDLDRLSLIRASAVLLTV